MQKTNKKRQQFERSGAWLRRARKKYFYLVWRKMSRLRTDKARQELLRRSMKRMYASGLYSKAYSYAAHAMIATFADLEGINRYSNWSDQIGWFLRQTQHSTYFGWESRMFEKKIRVA